MLNREYDLQITIAEPDGRVEATATDVENIRGGRKVVTRTYTTTGADPEAARTHAREQEDTATAGAVASGLATTGEVFAGGAMIINGFRTGDSSDVLIGFGLLLGAVGTGNLTRRADRIRTVRAATQTKLTEHYGLTVIPPKKTSKANS